MNDKGCIYLITCLPNAKKYVGQHCTTNHIIRWKQHLSSARNGSLDYIHNAIRKYGADNFTVERLCICHLEALGRLEAYYAEQYGCYMWDLAPGYNMVWCGDNFWLGMKHTPATRAKMSALKVSMPLEERKALGDRLQTPEARAKALEARLVPEVKEKQRQAALNRSPETLQKMSDAAKNMSPEARARQVEGGKKPEAREKKLTALKAAATIAKRKAAQKTIEYREKQRQGNLNRPSAQRAAFAEIGKNPTEATREKMRQAKLGKKQTSEQIEKKREAMLAIWANRRAAKQASRNSIVSVPPVIPSIFSHPTQPSSSP